MKVHPLFRFLTAFIIFSGIFQFKGVQFGPKNKPSYFQQSLGYVVLAGQLYLICEIYVNDLVVYGVYEDDFIQNLCTIVFNANSAKLKSNTTDLLSTES